MTLFPPSGSSFGRQIERFMKLALSRSPFTEEAARDVIATLHLVRQRQPHGKGQTAANDYILSQIPVGQMDPVQGLKAAFALQPDEVFLLTYGEFDRTVLRLIRKLNADDKVAVHMIILVSRGYQANETLLKIAEQNGGATVLVDWGELYQLSRSLYGK